MKPIVSDRLLAHLNEVFPDKLPPKGTTQEELARLQGTREVVEYIVSLHEDEDMNDVL